MYELSHTKQFSCLSGILYDLISARKTHAKIRTFLQSIFEVITNICCCCNCFRSDRGPSKKSSLSQLSYHVRTSNHHSRPQRLRSFWSAPRIKTSGWTWFLEHAQSTRLAFSANLICQILQWVLESCTSGVGSLPEVSILGADQEDRSLWGRESSNHLLLFKHPFKSQTNWLH